MIVPVRSASSPWHARAAPLGPSPRVRRPGRLRVAVVAPDLLAIERVQRSKSLTSPAILLVMSTLGIEAGDRGHARIPPPAGGAEKLRVLILQRDRAHARDHDACARRADRCGAVVLDQLPFGWSRRGRRHRAVPRADTSSAAVSESYFSAEHPGLQRACRTASSSSSSRASAMAGASGKRRSPSAQPGRRVAVEQ